MTETLAHGYSSESILVFQKSCILVLKAKVASALGGGGGAYCPNSYSKLVEATFVKSTRLQKYLKTILTPWYLFGKSR